MSLTRCAADNPLDKTDKAAVFKATRAFTGQGMAADVAAMRAVDELIAQLRGEKSKLEGESVAAVVKPAGILTALTTKSPEGTPYNLRNLLADFMKQSPGKAEDSTQRPLVVVKDLLSAWTNKTSQAIDFLKDKAVTDVQQAALDKFFEYAKFAKALVDKRLPKRKDNPVYNIDDMMLFLLNGEAGTPVDVDENLKTAIAYAAYKWAIDAAGTPHRLKDAQINAILGREKTAWVSNLARTKLGTAGTYQHLVVDSLGSTLMDVLGFSAIADAPQEIKAKLSMSLGTHALELLKDTGLVTETPVSGTDVKAMREDGLGEQQISKLNAKGETRTEATHFFYALNRDEDGNYAPNVQEIVDANKNSQDVIGKFFKAESNVIRPSLEPITTVQATTAGTDMLVPEEQRRVILLNQSRPKVVRKDTVLLLDGFSEEERLTMMGVVVEEDTDTVNTTTHIANRKGTLAKNAALRREYTSFNDYVGEYLVTSPAGLDTPFYLPYSVWKQQRVGIASTAINPQTSKIHRYLVGSPDWTTEIGLDNAELMDSFYLRVAEGLGVKTERADNTVSIEKIQTTLSEPVYAQAIDALHKQMVNKEVLSADEKANILAAVAKGGEKMHSLDVLIGLAYHKEAVLSGNASATFTVQMMGEVDGVANGTMFNHILLGAAGSAAELNAIANMGGFYEVGSTHNQYNQYRGTNGNRDIYETIGEILHQRMAAKLNNTNAVKGDGLVSLDAAHIASIWAISGEIFDNKTGMVTKDGRNLIKDAMNPLAFGSSIENTNEGMSATFLGSVYAGFERLAKQANPTTQAEVDAYVGHINNLIQNPKFHLKTGGPLQEHLNTPLSRVVETMLRSTFTATVGVEAAAVLETTLAPFLARRDSLNQTSDTAYGLYDAVYTGMREAYIEELIAADALVAVGPTGRMGDLSSKQEAELAKRIEGIKPIMRTAMSKNDKTAKDRTTGRSSGLFMAKSQRKQSKDKVYANRTGLGVDKKGRGVSLELRGFTRQLESPGVAMISAQTHSFDSAVMIRTQSENDVLGIHDAVGAGIGGLKKAAQDMNKQTWHALLEHSPLSEAYDALATTIYGISAMIDEGTLSPQALGNLKNYLAKNAWKFGDKPSDALEAMLLQAHEMAYQANKAKLSTMATWHYVDQYAYQGGNFEVTEQQRARAEQMLWDNKPELPAGDLQALEKLKGIMQRDIKKTTATAVAEKEQAQKADVSSETAEIVSMEDINAQAADANDDVNDFEGYDLSGLKETKTSPFGKLGKPDAVSDPDLVAFFNKNPQTTANQVIARLTSKLGMQAPSGPRNFNLKLLQMLSKTVSPTLTINLVTANTTKESVLGKPTDPAFGWHSSQGTEEAIYIAGNDFTHSNIRTEVLLHELTHAATTYHLTTTAGKPYRAELERLLTEVRTFIKQPGFEKYAAAVTSVDELVAYGMTSKDFQQNVLAKVQIKSGNALTTALQKFVDTLVGLLGFKDADAANGLGTLITNVTALMSQGSKEQAGLGNRTLSMAAKIGSYTTQDIHAALDNGTLAPAFQNHLSGLLKGMVESLHGPFGAFKESFMSKKAGTPLDVWAKAQSTGIAPFASQAIASGFPTSPQEAFAMEQVEATVAAALASHDASTKAAYKELYALYTEAHNTFKPSDFASQADYDFVFKIEQGKGGTSNYLARFAALGLANQKFNSMLQVASSTATRVTKVSNSFAERLQLAFQGLLDMFSRKVLHIYAGQPMDAKLGLLVDQLVDIEAKRVAALADTAWDVQLLNPMAKTSHRLTEAAKAGIANIGGSAAFQSSKLQSVKAVGALAKVLTTKGRTKLFLKAFRDLQDKHSQERMGVFSSLMQEYVGQSDVLQALLRVSKLNDGNRKDAISGFAKSATEGFIDNGKTMSQESRNAITPVFLRTGAHHLMDFFSLSDMELMLQDPGALQAGIAAIENKLASVPLALRADYIEKANTLGMYKATGQNLDMHLLKNAHNIARMFGTSAQAKISDQQAEQAQPVIAALVALYALEYSNPDQLKHAHTALQAENQRTDQENGVEFVLKLHKHMENESLERLFKGNPALMTHGYTPEVYDPYVTITSANAVDGAKLVAQGYSEGAILAVDPADPDRSERRIYVLQGLGMTRRLTGAISYEGKAAKGSAIHSGFTNANTANGMNNAHTNAGILNNRAQNSGNRSPTRTRTDLSKAKSVSYMAPVLDEQGNVTTWAYLMNESTKDALLHRDNRFDKVIGTLAGSIMGKESGIEQNEKVITVLKEQYDLDFAKNPDSYVLVGPHSGDKERREIWDLLPYETKEAIHKVWGKDGMLIRRDSMDIMFGYRKLSIADAFEKDPALRDLLDRVVVSVAQTVFGDKAALRMAQGERAWQDIVAEAKDTIVIKSGVVMLGNIKSNLWLLAMSGVPIKDILYHHLVALKGSHTFQKDSQELEGLKRLQATGYTQGKDNDIARQIARLEDSLARNPVKELMDAGLMPTIVEDVNPDDDIYSYKSGLARKLDEKLKKVSPLVIGAAKGIYMAHDTRLYQGIHRVTQLSDFVARYTLYQHLITQKSKPLTKAEAIQEASDAFINYDIPMHRSMQYLDDMGLMMFTKYFLRIQKVLVKNLKDNPGRVIGSILFSNYLNLGATVHEEASMWGRIGNNPFQMGPGKFFTSLDDLATIRAPMALIK